MLTGNLSYSPVSHALEMKLAGIKLANGVASIHAKFDEPGWRFAVSLRAANIKPLMALSHAWITAIPAADIDGQLHLELEASGREARVERLTWQHEIEQLTASNAAGTLAADKLALRGEGSLQQERSAWRFAVRTSSNRGQVYAEPVFLDFGPHGGSGAVAGRWNEAGVVELENIAVDHSDTLRAHGRATLSIGAQASIVAAILDVDEMRLPNAYVGYLQPFLNNATFKSLSTSGHLSGRIAIDANEPTRLDMVIAGITVSGPQSNVAVTDLDGEIHWSALESAAGEAAVASHLQWTDGSVLNLPLGAARIDFVTRGQTFALLQPASLPLLNGALDITHFAIQNAGSENIRLQLDAELRPIDVERLCRAFGWPEFGGQLAGKISGLKMERGVLTLGTTLAAHIFDGYVGVSDLRLEQALGKWPRLSADIALDKLDLEQVTHAFSFGRITGRLSGGIRDLELFDWMPVAFDADLHTAVDDHSPHKISQRAVANISSIGGSGASVTAALSSGFLRFFQDFGYDRLGWSCRLQNEVCTMGGIGPAKSGGFYIVKGSGVPRIDVIGNADRVDWPRLLNQLIAATRSTGPEVK